MQTGMRCKEHCWVFFLSICLELLYLCPKEKDSLLGVHRDVNIDSLTSYIILNLTVIIIIILISYVRHGHTEWSYRQFDKFFQQRGLDSSSPQCGRCYCHHQQRKGQTLTKYCPCFSSLIDATSFIAKENNHQFIQFYYWPEQLTSPFQS